MASQTPATEDETFLSLPNIYPSFPFPPFHMKKLSKQTLPTSPLSQKVADPLAGTCWISITWALNLQLIFLMLPPKMPAQANDKT